MNNWQIPLVFVHANPVYLNTLQSPPPIEVKQHEVKQSAMALYLCPLCPLTKPISQRRKTLKSYYRHCQLKHQQIALCKCAYSDCAFTFTEMDNSEDMLLHILSHVKIHTMVEKTIVLHESIQHPPIEHGYYCQQCVQYFTSSMAHEIHEKQVHSNSWIPSVTAQDWLHQIYDVNLVVATFQNIFKQLKERSQKEKEIHDSSMSLSATTSSCADDESTSSSGTGSLYYRKKDSQFSVQTPRQKTLVEILEIQI